MGRVPMLFSSEFFQCDHCNIALQSDGRGLELAIPINEEARGPERSRCSCLNRYLSN